MPVRAVDDKPSDTLVVVSGEGSWTGSSTLPHLHHFFSTRLSLVAMKAAVRDRYGRPMWFGSPRSTHPCRATVRSSCVSTRRRSIGPTSTGSIPGRRSSACSSACADRGTRGSAPMSPASSRRSGADVTRFAPGDRVFADLFSSGQGAFAEYVARPEQAFLPIPDGHVVRGRPRPSRTRRSSRCRACAIETAGPCRPGARS